MRQSEEVCYSRRVASLTEPRVGLVTALLAKRVQQANSRRLCTPYPSKRRRTVTGPSVLRSPVEPLQVRIDGRAGRRAPAQGLDALGGDADQDGPGVAGVGGA